MDPDIESVGDSNILSPHRLLLSRRETQQQHDTLSDAKDRAQLTATGAMSVVHVALLKTLLDEGPEENQFYEVLVGLISTALILQIAAGLIAIWACHIRTYFAKHRDDLCEDMLDTICCCRINCWQHTERSNFNNVQDETDNANRIHHYQSTDSVDTTFNLALPPNLKVPKVGRNCWCCYLLATTYSLHEKQTMALYDQWDASRLMIDMSHAEADVRQPCINKKIKDIKAKMNEMKDSMPQSGMTTHQEEIEDIEPAEELKILTRENQKLEEIKRKWSIARAQGNILCLQNEQIRRNHVLKLCTFWQNLLNYVFYIVFVLNAFITGLGISGNNAYQTTNSQELNVS